MASGFSLGAAIGATGKFPKLKSPEIDSAASDRQAREIAAVRSRVTVDNTRYHKVFIDENNKETASFIQSILNAERTKDPSVIDITYNGELNLAAKRNNYQNYSMQFFDIENKVENAQNKKSNDYVSPGMEALYDALRTSTSKEQLLEKYQKNPQMFADGYVSLEKTDDGFVVPKVLFHEKYNFTEVFHKGNVFDLKNNGVVISESKKNTNEGREIDRYISIPANRQEALELKKTNPNINENANAFDLGKDWFSKNPTAQMQYRAQLASDEKPDALDPYKMNFDDLYKQLYVETILPNIPAKYENIDQLQRRTIVNVNVDNVGTRTAPTDYTVGPTTMNYMGKTNSLKSDFSAPVSPKSEGTTVTIPTNGYIVGLEDGLPAFTSTAQKQFTISRVAVFPAVRGTHTYTDPKTKETRKFEYLRPITADELAVAKKNKVPYLMYPFAIANNQSLSIAKAPEIGVGGYAIPLYEPDANGRWVIPQNSRKVKTTGGSPLLSQVVQKNDWDEASQKNWDNAFFSMMGAVKDQNDIKQK